jgi:ribosomal protein L7Ae-like RNA K-turn-binding protein
MKRAIVWIDCKDAECDKLLKDLKKFLAKKKVPYTVVDVCDLFGVETSR